MHGNARWGHVLNVEDAYLSSSHFFIRSLFSGVHGNGSSVGGCGATSRMGHEHVGSPEGRGVLHPSLIDRVALIGGSPQW